MLDPGQSESSPDVTTLFPGSGDEVADVTTDSNPSAGDMVRPTFSYSRRGGAGRIGKEGRGKGKEGKGPGDKRKGGPNLLLHRLTSNPQFAATRMTRLSG